MIADEDAVNIVNLLQAGAQSSLYATMLAYYTSNHVNNRTSEFVNNRFGTINNVSTLAAEYLLGSGELAVGQGLFVTLKNVTKFSNQDALDVADAFQTNLEN